jgi:hypothetical protein
MDWWSLRYVVASATIPPLLLLFYLALRVQRWKFSEEVHMSEFDKMFLKAKYYIFGTGTGILISAISIYIGW